MIIVDDGPVSRTGMRWLSAAMALLLGASLPRPLAAQQRALSGAEIVRAMHDAFATRWYRTLAFDQSNTAYDAAGRERHSEWHEFIAVPGRLRIEYEPLAQHGGALVRNDSAYRFADGRLRAVRAYVEPFALLLSDVYALPPERSIHLLDSLGFALGTTYDTTWNGRAVVVVGAVAGDTTSPQFWIDRQTWLLSRVIQRERRTTGTVITDVHVLARARDLAVPVEAELLFRENGRPVWRERYTNVRIDPTLPDALFDPAVFVEHMGFRAVDGARPREP